MLRCQKTSSLIASDAVHSARWTQRMAVTVHLLLCRHCRRYAKQLRALRTVGRELFSTPPRGSG